MAYTAAVILDSAALWLNDVNKTKFSYTVLTPFLKEAYQELEDIFINNQVRYSFKGTAPIAVAANAVASTLTLPADFSLPISVWERPSGATTQPSQVDETNAIPLGIQAVESLRIWNWSGQAINLPPVTTAREVILYYWKTLPIIINDTSNIDINHVKTFLSGRTGALAAFIIDENQSRSSMLADMANVALARALGIETKKLQNRPARRRPFRAFHPSRRRS